MKVWKGFPRGNTLAEPLLFYKNPYLLISRTFLGSSREVLCNGKLMWRTKRVLVEPKVVQYNIWRTLWFFREPLRVFLSGHRYSGLAWIFIWLLFSCKTLKKERLKARWNRLVFVGDIKFCETWETKEGVSAHLQEAQSAIP